MNENAIYERERNKEYIISRQDYGLDGRKLKILEIDTNRAIYRGTKVKDLDATKRRKFENMLFFSENPIPVHITYR